MITKQIEPFYFKSNSNLLYGCFHSPRSANNRDCCIVLCSSIGEEYIRFHRALRQLAELFTKAGFPVLRFDFYGCGDSSGDFQQCSFKQMKNDVYAAVNEMRTKSGIEKVCLTGLRAGASMALFAAIEDLNVDSLILWDPVIKGDDYINELKTLHNNMMSYAHVMPKPELTNRKNPELLGYSYAPELINDIKSINLLAVTRKPANNILIIESNKMCHQQQFYDYLKNKSINIKKMQLLNPQLWVWEEAFGKVQVPIQILQSIVSWTSEVYS